jgi:CDP-diacylglycerol--serine O-phosphatidyltransferase
MIISFQTDWDLVKQPFFVAIFIFAVSGLLVSQLPTYSFKSLRIQHRFILLTMLVVGLVAALAASAPWLTLTIILIFYIISIPLGLQSYKRQKDKASKIAVSLNTNISPGPEE